MTDKPMRIQIAEPSKEHPTHYVPVFVSDPLPGVPSDMLIVTNAAAEDRPIKTPHRDHPFDSMTGEFGYPKEIVSTVSRYADGEIDETTAVAMLGDTLTRWSQGANWDPGHASANYHR
jgi:hypothetical protein